MNSSNKKPFNKKAFFQQKYKKNFGSRQEGHGQALLQKEAILRQYRKEKKIQGKKERRAEKERNFLHQGEGATFSSNEESRETTADTSEGTLSNHPQKKKMSSMQRAKLRYHEIVTEKQRAAEERIQKKKEIELAKQRRKDERLKRYKKLNQKTKKGQPVMRGRIELMLEQIEREMS